MRSQSIFTAFVSKHICTELGLSSKKKLRLINDEYGIRNPDDLLRLESRLENGDLGSMEVEIKKKLLVAAEWILKNPGVVVSEHFCSDVWDDWVKSSESNEVGMDAEMTVSLLLISPTLFGFNSCRAKF